MKVTMDNLNLLHSALTFFVKEPVKEYSKFEDSIVFTTDSGKVGFVEKNFVGNLDVWIGDDVVYEIERELYELIDCDTRKDDLIGFYSELRKEQIDFFQERSKEFFRIVKDSIENIIVNHDLPIQGCVTIGPNQVYYSKGCKIKVNLN